MWLLQTVLVFLWCILVSGYPTPTMRVNTRLPREKGCSYQGKWYEINTEISKGDDGRNWCFGVFCNSDGQALSWDDFKCNRRTTTEPPTTQMPTTVPGCEYHGRFYEPGEKIDEGVDRSSNWCYETWCGEHGEVIHGDNFNCFTTTTTSTPVVSTPVDIPIDNEDVAGHSEEKKHKGIKNIAVEWTEDPGYSGDFTVPPAGTDEEITTSPTEHEGSTTEPEGSTSPTDDREYTTTYTGIHRDIDTETTNRPTTEHEGSAHHTTDDEDITTTSSADYEDTTEAPTTESEDTTIASTTDYEDTTISPTSDYEETTTTTESEDTTISPTTDNEDTTISPTSDYEETTTTTESEDTTIASTTDYEDTTFPPDCDFPTSTKMTTPTTKSADTTTTKSEDTTTTEPEDTMTAPTTIPEDSTTPIGCFFGWLSTTELSTTVDYDVTPTSPEDTPTSPEETTTSPEETTKSPTVAEGCWYEGKRYTPGAIVRGSRGTWKWGIICLKNGEIWHYDAFNTGPPSTAKTNKEVSKTTPSSVIAKRSIIVRPRDLETGL